MVLFLPMTEPEMILPTIGDGEDKTSPFKNCIRKNYRHVRKWAKRTKTNAFRVYDREIGRYPLAIDFYAGRFCVQYFSPARDDSDDPPEELIAEVEQVLLDIFGAEPSSVYWRNRIKREKYEQYEKASELKEFFTIYEYGVKFKINLLDYLDTGLFLDHRETRRIVASIARGKRLLNLFAYTCSFSVHAAAAGSSFTKSVDMSNTYTTWGEDNFLLNGLSLRDNEVVRADCLKFMDEEIRSGAKYDLIVIDPPTISRSKKMERMFDVQEDYIFLISRALKLLAPGGEIFFSTNSRKFSFDESQFALCKIREISEKTFPLDFHKRKIHRCWNISQ